jgi:hypothetical protein
MDSTLLQNSGASAKANPKSSIMLNREFGHRNTNPRKSTASSIIPDPKKRILELKNPTQNMCYLSLKGVYILGLHNNWCRPLWCLCHPFQARFLSSNLLFCLMLFCPVLGTICRNRKKSDIRESPWQHKKS